MDFIREQAVIIGTAFALILLCTLVEIIAPREKHRLSSRWPGLLFQFWQVAGGAMLAWPLIQLYAYLGFRPILPPIEQWAGIFAVPVAIVAADFLRYWEHRFEHRFMWNVHAVHHSQEELHAANTYGHPLQAIPVFVLTAVPLSLLNFSSLGTPLVVGLILAFMTFFIHAPTDIHFGRLRRLLVDHPYHRVHHSTDPAHFNRNFSIVFPAWDMLFGTAHFPAKDEWPVVGLADMKPPKSVREYLLLPFARSELPSFHVSSRAELL